MSFFSSLFFCLSFFLSLSQSCFLPVFVSLSFFLSHPFFRSLILWQQKHMLKSSYKHDILHYTPVLLPRCKDTCRTPTVHSWYWLTLCSSTFSFPHLFPPLSPFLFTFFLFSLNPLLPPSLHPSSPHAFSEPLGIDDGGHMTKGAAPGHVCVTTALPDTMTRTHATWLRLLKKTLLIYLLKPPRGQNLTCF